MTLAKTCHASSTMQELVKATHIAITKAVWIATFQLFHYWIGRKLNLILKLEVATLNEYISHFVAYSFVANFVRYISAKYYLNWFSFHTVIMKVLGVNFFLKHSVCLYPEPFNKYSTSNYSVPLNSGSMKVIINRSHTSSYSSCY